MPKWEYAIMLSNFKVDKLMGGNSCNIKVFKGASADTEMSLVETEKLHPAQMLNLLGQDGWELVAVTQFSVLGSFSETMQSEYTLKRQIQTTERKND